jgi:3-hydroxyisobutyrate dehydrogenase-like beta-hydroxyacid dehydrogenase
MAQRIVGQGFPMTVWARRAETLEPFVAAGAQVATSRHELGAASEILCICVLADQDVDDVLRGPEGALAGMAPGGVVVVHSTVHPDTCRRLQDDHPELRVIDAPVSGGGHMAAQRQLLVMVGGDADAFERCRPVLETFADPLVHLGPLGAGQEAKLLNNALFAAQLGLVADAFATATERGLDPAALRSVLEAGSSRSYAAQIIGGSGFGLAGMASIAGPLLAKDVAILSELLAPGTPTLISAAQAAVDAMAQAGRGA